MCIRDIFFFFLMTRSPPRSTQSRSSAASDVYKRQELPGWQEDITKAKTLDDLPENARRYVERITELLGVDLLTFSVGPDRDQTNVLENVWDKVSR